MTSQLVGHNLLTKLAQVLCSSHGLPPDVRLTLIEPIFWMCRKLSPKAPLG